MKHKSPFFVSVAVISGRHSYVVSFTYPLEGGGGASIRVLDNVEKRKTSFPAINKKKKTLWSITPPHIGILTLIAINNFNIENIII
jgi:hypothetical protein